MWPSIHFHPCGQLCVPRKGLSEEHLGLYLFAFPHMRAWRYWLHYTLFRWGHCKCSCIDSLVSLQLLLMRLISIPYAHFWKASLHIMGTLPLLLSVMPTRASSLSSAKERWPTELAFFAMRIPDTSSHTILGNNSMLSFPLIHSIRYCQMKT